MCDSVVVSEVAKQIQTICKGHMKFASQFQNALQLVRVLPLCQIEVC